MVDNQEFRRLHDEYARYDAQLGQLSHKRFLTEQEQAEELRLKKLKLHAKDQMDKAIECCRRDKFLRDANADFAAVKCDKEAWKEELEERELWEQTLADGLAEE